MQSVQYWTSACYAASSLHDYLLWRSCSSGRNFARAVSMFLRIQLLSDSILRWTPLPSANDSYCQVRSGLSPPSYRPCRAHDENSLPKPGGIFLEKAGNDIQNLTCQFFQIDTVHQVRINFLQIPIRIPTIRIVECDGNDVRAAPRNLADRVGCILG